MSLCDDLRDQIVHEFRSDYLRYDALLAELPASRGESSHHSHPALDALVGASQASPTLPPPGPSHAFLRGLLSELARVQDAVRRASDALWSELLELSRRCLRPASLGGAAGGAGADAAPALQSQAPLQALTRLRELLHRFVRLDTFLQHCSAAAAALALAHDGRPPPTLLALATGAGQALSGPSRVYRAAACAALSKDLHLDSFLVALSDAFALSRALDSGEAGRGSVEAQWVAPSSFTRVTRKFWLRPGDVTRFKAAVIPHLPVLIYGDRTRLLDLEELREGADSQACVALPLPSGAPAPLRRVSDAALVTSVYLDSPPELPLYHARLARDDRAIALRVRWYGDEPPGPQSRVFMERKVHREAWTGALSTKDRAPLLYAQVGDLLSGQGVDPTLAARAKKEGGKKKRLLSFSARVLRNVAFPEEQARGSPFLPATGPSQLEPSVFLREVAALVQQTRARPLLRTVYRRTAFQEPTTAAVRLSMDVDLHMVREVGAAKRPGDWARDVAGAPLAPGDVAVVPYVVVEVKLQQAPPRWLVDLVASGMLLPVPKFSKYLHGTAALFQSSLRAAPHWFLPSPASPGALLPASWEELEEGAAEILEHPALHLFPPREGGGPQPGQDTSLRARTSAELRQNLAAKSAQFAARIVQRVADRRPQRVGSCQVEGAAGGPALAPAALQLPLPTTSPPRAPEQAPSPPALFLLETPGSADLPGAASRGPAPPAAWPVYELSGAGPELRDGDLRRLSGESQGRKSGSSGKAASSLEDSARDLDGDLGKKGDKVEARLEEGRRPGACAPLPWSILAPGLAAEGGQASEEPEDESKKVARQLSLANGRLRVEPKTFFANERTFLQWLQISVLIMFTSLSLLNGGSVGTSISSSSSSSCDPSDGKCQASRMSGAIIAPVALLFMVYALYRYRRRTNQILRREVLRYDDQKGPVWLVVVLISVTIATYIICMVYSF